MWFHSVSTTTSARAADPRPMPPAVINNTAVAAAAAAAATFVPPLPANDVFRLRIAVLQEVSESVCVSSA
jgi:hypothetical protein